MDGIVIAICVTVLLVVMGIAKLVNAIAKRPLVNGAAVFFWLLLAASVGLLGYQWSLPHLTEKMAHHGGRAVGTAIPFLLLSYFLGRSFRKRHSTQGGTTPEGSSRPSP